MVFSDKEKKAIYKYYKYKNEYENERKEKIDKIRKKNKGNEKEIQLQIARMKLPCTYCKRNVNTKFIKEENKLIIMCGDNTTPCSDKLEILLPNYIHVNRGIELYEKTLDELRNKIVKVRADLTYEFIEEEEAINEFKYLNEEFNSYADTYTGLLLYKGNIEEDKEREHMIISKLSEIKNFKQNCSQILKQYEKTPTTQLLNDYVEMMSCKLLPLKQKMQELVYSFQEIVKVEKENDEKGYGKVEYNLVQRKNLFELYEHIFDDRDLTILDNKNEKNSKEKINEISIQDSEENKRNKNNEINDVSDSDEEDNNENDNNNNNVNRNLEETKKEPTKDDNMEEVEIGVGNISKNDEPVKLRPKNNEYETDSDEDDVDEDDEDDSENFLNKLR